MFPDTANMTSRSRHDAKKMRDLAHLMRFLSANVSELGMRGALEAAKKTSHSQREHDTINTALAHEGRERNVLATLVESERWAEMGSEFSHSDSSVLMEIALDLERTARSGRKPVVLHSPYYHRELEHESRRIEEALEFSSLDEGTRALIMNSVDRISEIVRADTEERFEI